MSKEAGDEDVLIIEIPADPSWKVTATAAPTSYSTPASVLWLHKHAISLHLHNGSLRRAFNYSIFSKKTPTPNKSEREKQIPYDTTSIWNLIYGTNEPFHRKENHGLGEQTCGCQWGWGRNGTGWAFGISRCKLLPLEWISNEILL